MEKPVVLVADDNEATCTLIAAVLQNRFVVEVVSDGLEAIERLKSRQYAAILLDLHMPVADGYAVLDFLTAEHPEVLQTVIVVTAAVSSRETERLSHYTFCSLVSKPFEVEHLLNLVRHCAGSSGSDPFRGTPIFSSGMLLMLAAEVLRKF